MTPTAQAKAMELYASLGQTTGSVEEMEACDIALIAAALQATEQRVLELEHENKNLLTCQCEQCDNSLEQEAVCGNCYRKVQALLDNEKENSSAFRATLDRRDQVIVDLQQQLAICEQRVWEKAASYWEHANCRQLAAQYPTDEYPKWSDIFAAWCRKQSNAARQGEETP